MQSKILIDENSGKYAITKGGTTKYYFSDGTETEKDKWKGKDYSALVNKHKARIAEYRKENDEAIYYTDVQLAAVIKNDAGIQIYDNGYDGSFIGVRSDGKFYVGNKYYDNQGHQISEEKFNKRDYTNITPFQKEIIKKFRKVNPKLSKLTDIQALYVIYNGISYVRFYSGYDDYSDCNGINVTPLLNNNHAGPNIQIFKNKNFCICRFPNQYRNEHTELKSLTDNQFAIILYYKPTTAMICADGKIINFETNFL